MIARSVLILVFCSFFSTFMQATEIAGQWSQANAAYQSGAFNKAIEQYEALLKQGYHSEALYYNLGNSYYRINKLGKAVLNYERALLLDPTDADTKHNLQVVRNHLQDKIEPLPEFFLSKWWNHLRSQISPNGWSALSLSLLWLGIAALSIWLLGKKEVYKKWGFILGISLLIISLIGFMLSYSRKQAIQNSGRAVILQSEVALQSAPDSKSKVILPLHEGTTFKFLDKIGDWYKVSLENGEQGWIPKANFVRI